MKQKICLITGATDGIGKATAVRLVAKGYKVVLVARNEVKAESVIRELRSVDKTADPDYLLADLSSLTQVYNMLRLFKARYRDLDVLINNAGVVVPGRKITEDGLEKTFQVNYLSPFIITNSLLGHLGRSDNGRIINVTSNIYTLGQFDPATIQGKGRYSAIKAYASSKLYLLMFTEELAARVNGGVTVNSMHPGIVRTNMSTQVQGFPFLFKAISFVALPFAITPEKAAETALLLATSDSVRNTSGKYFTNLKPVMTKSKFDTPENRRLLWDISMNLSNTLS